MAEIFKLNKDFNSEVIKQRIQPILVDLINDEDLEVKLEALLLLAPWSKYSPDTVLMLLKEKKIKIDLTHKSWRVRMHEIHSIMNISKTIGKGKQFEQYFKPLFLKSARDVAYDVR